MKKLKIAAIGTEHRHIFGQLKGMLDLGCECVGWWNDGDNKIKKSIYMFLCLQIFLGSVWIIEYIFL